MLASSEKKKVVARLKRIEGQVSAIRRMIEEDRYCIDILNQISAIKGALSRVEEKILRKHFEGCVTEAVQGGSEQERRQKLDEVLQLIHQTRRG